MSITDIGMKGYNKLMVMVAESIKTDEGTVKNANNNHVAYKCPAGKWTIGFGRNIDAEGGLGLTDDEATFLLTNDVTRVFHSLVDNIYDFNSLSDERQIVLINMCFNLGLPRFLQFKKMIAAIKVNDFDEAAIQLLDSRYARQVGQRANRLAEALRDNTFIRG